MAISCVCFMGFGTSRGGILSSFRASSNFLCITPLTHA